MIQQLELLSLTSNSAFPIVINGTNNGKIIIESSSSPYIQFQEGTTSKAYVQWHQDGHIKIHNSESGEELRVGSGNNGLQYEVDGSVKTVYPYRQPFLSLVAITT